MDTLFIPDLADAVIATLRAHERELRAGGVKHMSLFGSMARGDAEGSSDVDLTVAFDPAARVDLFQLVALERRLGDLLGRRVDLVPEPVERPSLRLNIERDRRPVF